MNSLVEVKNLIYEIRGFKVMLDSDLADLYEVPTKRFNEAVKRNIARFPKHYMFQLTNEEYQSLRSQIATSNKNAVEDVTCLMYLQNKGLQCFLRFLIPKKLFK